MGKKKNHEFVKAVTDLAHDRGLRVGILIIEGTRYTSGYTEYKTQTDAHKGLLVLKDILDDLDEGESE